MGKRNQGLQKRIKHMLLLLGVVFHSLYLPFKCLTAFWYRRPGIRGIWGQSWTQMFKLQCENMGTVLFSSLGPRPGFAAEKRTCHVLPPRLKCPHAAHLWAPDRGPPYPAPVLAQEPQPSPALGAWVWMDVGRPEVHLEQNTDARLCRLGPCQPSQPAEQDS